MAKKAKTGSDRSENAQFQHSTLSDPPEDQDFIENDKPDLKLSNPVDGSAALRSRLERYSYTDPISSASTRTTRSHTRGQAQPQRNVDQQPQVSRNLDEIPSPETTTARPKSNRDGRAAQSAKTKSEDDEYTEESERLKKERSVAAKPSLKRRRTGEGRAANDEHSVENKLVDSIRPGLILVMIGVNPGLTTAATGHAYSHKSNKYWPTMHQSGVLPVFHPPEDTHKLMDLYGIGHTNIVPRATRSEVGIGADEWQEGARLLDAKIAKFKPQAVALVGKRIWQEWFRLKKGRKFKPAKDDFAYGWQDDEEMQLGRIVDMKSGRVVWPGAKTIVVATTSGLATQFAPDKGAGRLKIWRPLGEWIAPKREDWVRRREEEEEEGKEKRGERQGAGQG